MLCFKQWLWIIKLVIAKLTQCFFPNCLCDKPDVWQKSKEQVFPISGLCHPCSYQWGEICVHKSPHYHQEEEGWSGSCAQTCVCLSSRGIPAKDFSHALLSTCVNLAFQYSLCCISSCKNINFEQAFKKTPRHQKSPWQGCYQQTPVCTHITHIHNHPCL